MYSDGNYMPNYFSIPDILATQEKVPCKFEVRVKQLGMLDRGGMNRDIEVGASIELPLWLVKTFSRTRVKIVDISLPSTYNENQRDILNADESVVDLHKTYFYEFGMHLATLPISEAPEVTSMLLQTFKARFRFITDWAMNAIVDTKGVQRLDRSEERIYFVGKEAASRLRKWLEEGEETIEAGKMVVSHYKRKDAVKSINMEL